MTRATPDRAVPHQTAPSDAAERDVASLDEQALHAGEDGAVADGADGVATDEVPARLRMAIGRLSRRLRHTAAGAGLTPTEISVLITVVKRGPLRLADLAEMEALNPTMLSRVAGRLTELGLIDRSTDPEDRRAALVQGTAAGRRMRRRIHSERTKALQEPISRLSERQRASLEAALPVLEQLADSLGEAQR